MAKWRKGKSSRKTKQEEPESEGGGEIWTPIGNEELKPYFETGEREGVQPVGFEQTSSISTDFKSDLI